MIGTIADSGMPGGLAKAGPPGFFIVTLADRLPEFDFLLPPHHLNGDWIVGAA